MKKILVLLLLPFMANGQSLIPADVIQRIEDSVIDKTTARSITAANIGARIQEVMNSADSINKDSAAAIRARIHNTPEYNPNKFYNNNNRALATPVIPFGPSETKITYYTGSVISGGDIFSFSKGSVNNYIMGFVKYAGVDTYAYWGNAIPQGSGGEPDESTLWDPCAFIMTDTVYVAYKALNASNDAQVGLAFKDLASMPTQLTKEAGVVIISKSQVETAVGYTTTDISPGDVLTVDGTHVMYLSFADAATNYTIWYATSTDLRNWTIGSQLIDTNARFDVMSSPSVVQLDDGFYYMYYDKRTANEFSGEIGVAYSISPYGPFKELPGTFLRVENGDEFYTDFTARIYAGRLIKDSANLSTLATIDGYHIYQYSAATQFNGGDHEDRTFEAKFNVGVYKSDTAINSYVLVDGGNHIPNPMTLGTKYFSGVTDHSVSILIAGTEYLKVNNSGRVLLGSGQIDWGFALNAANIGVGDYIVFKNASAAIVLGNEFTYVVEVDKPAHSIHIGSGAGQHDSLGVGGIRIGRNSWQNGNSLTSIYIGDQIAQNAPDGSQENSVVGNYAIYGGGTHNSGVGNWAGFNSTVSMVGNAWLGWEAMRNCVGCQYNTIVGMQSARQLVHGQYNVYFGFGQGYYAGDESFALRIGNTLSDPIIFSANAYVAMPSRLLTINANLTGAGTITSVDDVEITTEGSGVIVKSPDGTRWRLTVDNSGNAVFTSL